MDAKQLAAQLSGSQYPLTLSDAQLKIIKDAGLVVVYGYSDDLMEFEGAISGELDAYEGVTAFVDSQGLIESWSTVSSDEDRARDYFARKPHAFQIKQVWDDHELPAWTHHTDIPHEKFNIMDDGVVYSTGIVFALADLKAPE